MTIKSRIGQYKKESIVALLLLIVLLIVDWWINRPNVSYTPPESQIEISAEVAEQDSLQPLREGTALQAYLASFVVAETPPEEDVEVSTEQRVMDDEAQARQQGLLRELIVGDKSYRLQAVIQVEEAVAIFREQHLPDGSLQTVTLREGEALGPYTLSELSLTQAHLRRGDNTVYLRLFAPARSFGQEDTPSSNTDESEQTVNGDL